MWGKREISRSGNVMGDIWRGGGVCGKPWAAVGREVRGEVLTGNMLLRIEWSYLSKDYE